MAISSPPLLLLSRNPGSGNSADEDDQGWEDSRNVPPGSSSGKKRPRSEFRGVAGAPQRGGEERGGMVIPNEGVRDEGGASGGAPAEDDDDGDKENGPRENERRKRRKVGWGWGFLRLWRRGGESGDEDEDEEDTKGGGGEGDARAAPTVGQAASISEARRSDRQPQAQQQQPSLGVSGARVGDPAEWGETEEEECGDTSRRRSYGRSAAPTLRRSPLVVTVVLAPPPPPPLVPPGTSAAVDGAQPS